VCCRRQIQDHVVVLVIQKQHVNEKRDETPLKSKYRRSNLSVYSANWNRNIQTTLQFADSYNIMQNTLDYANSLSNLAKSKIHYTFVIIRKAP
jgi:hypothetical protein